nr:putative reverse transcriptase domain-containing protein [Tanacetum cinerariifolium]
MVDSLRQGKDRKRLLQFLMGLDECFSNVRGQILLMQPLPNANKAYAMMKQEERQMETSTPKFLTPTVMYTFNNSKASNTHTTFQNTMQTRTSTIPNTRKSAFKPGVICGNCQKEGHYQSECYQLVGHPVGHPLHGKVKPQGNRTNSGTNKTSNFIPRTINLATRQGSGQDDASIKLMKLMTEVYYLRNKVQKMESELWNLTVKNNDLTVYTQRFQELTMLCTKMVHEEEDRIENLMDQKLKGYVVKNAENKRRLEVNQRDNHGQQPPFKRPNVGGQNMARAYTAGNNERKPYNGLLPLCNKCGGDANPDSNVVKGGKGEKSKLNIISCTKTQKYIKKGCPIFLAQITKKESVDKSEEKRLEDVPTVREFSKVFPEDFPGLPPTRQVEFQIDLVPSAALVARTPYRLAP